ncbi:hypothetical protein L208DRAFT_1316823, partial [Tricholoma matsutake]
LPSMPEKLDKWYNWAMCLDWQYWQEQAEMKLMYGSSKFGKPSGGKSEKGKAPQSAAPDTMEVDQAGRLAPLKCFNCGQLGHKNQASYN